MAKAYVLLNCDLGSEKNVISSLKEIEEVKEARETFGPYGAVIKVESDSIENVKHILNEKIRSIQRVRSSLTLVEST